MLEDEVLTYVLIYLLAILDKFVEPVPLPVSVKFLLLEFTLSNDQQFLVLFTVKQELQGFIKHLVLEKHIQTEILRQVIFIFDELVELIPCQGSVPFLVIAHKEDE